MYVCEYVCVYIRMPGEFQAEASLPSGNFSKLAANLCIATTRFAVLRSSERLVGVLHLEQLGQAWPLQVIDNLLRKSFPST